MIYIECPTEYHGAGPDISLFLGGGISNCPQWQQEMVAKLGSTDLTLVNPRRADFDVSKPNIAIEQIEWEHRHMLRCEAILFWFPSETLCPIALYELGLWNFRPKKLFIGCHPDYKRRLDVEVQTRIERTGQRIVYCLGDLAAQVIEWEARRHEDRYARDTEQPAGKKLESQKDAIVERAKQVCRWIGWLENADPRALAEVKKLKNEIEQATGKELEIYS